MTCPLLDELDRWFALARNLLARRPDVLRDLLLLVGGAGRVGEVVTVTAGDCHEVAGHLVAYVGPGRSLPLTPAFLATTGLRAADWPTRRADPAADAAALERAISAVDVVFARTSGIVRPAGAGRLRELRLHAWHHTLGPHVPVLARFYGPDLSAPACPATRDRAVARVA